MNRKLKAIGLAVAALLAMALSASTASAAGFHSEVSEAEILGEQVEESDTWTFNAGTFKCNSATYSGTLSSMTPEEIAVTPTYSECTAFGFVGSSVDLNGCEIKLRQAAPFYFLDCPGTTGYMTLTAFNCWVTLPEQKFNTGITWKIEGSGSSRDLHFQFNLEGRSYTQHSKSFPGCTNGVFMNGTQKARGTATARNNGNQVGFWKS